MIDQDCWNRYYDYWDTFIKEWFDSQRKFPDRPHNEIAEAYVESIPDLFLDSLPIPYLGSPHKGVRAVIASLNPGLRDAAEETLYLSNIDKGHSGWLIREFRGECHATYSEYIQKWSPLLHHGCDKKASEYVCGSGWWTNKRMEWLRRIYGNPGLRRSEIFAVELCPFHSREFRFHPQRLTRDARDCLISFVAEQVVMPIIVAVEENTLPFAVANGKWFAKVLDAIGKISGTCGMFVENRREWEWSVGKADKKDGSWNVKLRELADIWPHNNKEPDKPVVRSYRLYRVSFGGKCVKILCTWADGGFNAPSKEFAPVEEHIRKSIETL